MIAAIDVNGTRVNPRPDRIENIHIHSFWLLQPGQGDGFAAELEKARVDSMLDIRAIRVDPCTGMDKRSGNVSRLSSYMVKFVGANTDDMRVVEDFRIYPYRGGNGIG